MNSRNSNYKDELKRLNEKRAAKFEARGFGKPKKKKDDSKK